MQKKVEAWEFHASGLCNPASLLGSAFALVARHENPAPENLDGLWFHQLECRRVREGTSQRIDE